MAEVQRETTLKRLARKLSRSGGSAARGARSESAGRNGVPTSPKEEKEFELGHAFSTSPPPDMYFPPPPIATMRSAEATGTSRDPESRGARAADIGTTNQGAPGVSFAPSLPGRLPRPPSEHEHDAWNPPPRRSQSVRHTQRRPPAVSRGASEGPPISPSGGGATRNGIVRRERASSASTTGSTKSYSSQIGNLPTLSSLPATPPNGTTNGLPMGERRGVQLEDKPLSRRTSVKKAATVLKKAVEKSFAPAAKQAGEKRVLILVADGSEEIEVLTPFDVFVRASLGPVIASVSPIFSPSQSLPYITLSRGAKMMADTHFESFKAEWKEDFDAVIIPGGAKGAERLSKDPSVQSIVADFHSKGKLVGMICAGSLTAKTANLPSDLRLTSHPSVKSDLEKHFRYSEDRVVVSGNLVTSRGPGTALEWSLKIVELLAGKAKREEVEGPMCL